MDIEEGLRTSFAAAGERLPGAPLDHDRTMEVARHLWMRQRLWLGVWLLAVAVLVAALWRL